MHSRHKKSAKIFTLALVFIFSFFITSKVNADVLDPALPVTSCGELVAPSTYTLGANITAAASTTSVASTTCFTVSSDGVTIDGGISDINTGKGYTVTASGVIDVAADARRYNTLGGALTEGGNAYTNLLINNITFSGFTNGINLNGNKDTDGNGVNNGYGGAAGDVAVYYSSVGNISVTGGSSATKQYGNLGGNIIISGTDVDISSSTFLMSSGAGTSGVNIYIRGSLSVNYTTSFRKDNLYIDNASFIKLNGVTLVTNYIAGSWPIFPGDVTSCGTLVGPGTFNLVNDVEINGTNTPAVLGRYCFIAAASGIILNGNHHTITIIASSTHPVTSIFSNSYGDLTINNLKWTGASKTFNIFSTGALTINSDSDLDFSGLSINSRPGLTLNYVGSFITSSSTSASSYAFYIKNGVNYGPTPSGVWPTWMTRVNAGARAWGTNDIAVSADGTRVVAAMGIGNIFISTDSGVTWATSTGIGSFNWYGAGGGNISSSFDGMKLTAAAEGGYIYLSNDGGDTWATSTASGVRSWYSVSSSADGKKIVGAVYDNYIYISNDRGLTWTTHATSLGAQYWRSVLMSADGKKIIAGTNDYAFTSGDGGITWATSTSAGTTTSYSFASSADTNKLIAAYGNAIHTSSDWGVTWATTTSPSITSNWKSVSSSADGTKLLAGNSGETWLSYDSGNTWQKVISTVSGSSVKISADGNKMFSSYNSGGAYIYSYINPNPTLSVNLINPPYSSSTSIWPPFVSWGTATTCEYSYDGGSLASSTCANNGSDILKPATSGTHTLSLIGTDASSTTVTKQWTFSYVPPITINNPLDGSSDGSWPPSIIWDANNTHDMLSCYYSFNNWVSSTSALCANNGSDISAPSLGTSTLYLRVFDNAGNKGEASTTFLYVSGWTSHVSIGARDWRSVAMSIDGRKIVAAVYNGYIYTSTDYGNTWAVHNSDGAHLWHSLASSADGTKLAVADFGTGYIYTSSDSGNTWKAQTGAGSHKWISVTMSLDGKKLAAVDNTPGYIYTSSDGGTTWTEETAAGSRSWYNITSSPDGINLSAAVSSGYIYNSSSSGLLWATSSSVSAGWKTVAISADGIKRFAGVTTGNIYVSTSSGVNWIPITAPSSRAWQSINSSADGTKVVAGVYSGYIYTSTASGLTWATSTTLGTSTWYSIKSTPDGSRLAAVSGGTGGYIYTYVDPNPTLKVDFLIPATTTSVINTWPPIISWGTATTCEYSYDSGATSTADCAMYGSGISKPPSGTHTLNIKGSDALNNTVSKQITFAFSLPISISLPVASSTVYLWSTSTASVLWDVNNTHDISSCYYSYDNWVSSSTALCANNGSDIHKPSSYGSNTLYVRAFDSAGRQADASTTFTLSNEWTVQAAQGIQGWRGITSSALGKKIFAEGTLNNGYIYTSLDSGSTWIVNPQNGAHFWRSIASSFDGSKLIASTFSPGTGAVFTSTDYGASWVTSNTAGSGYWLSVASSADGTKLAAVDASSTPGYIYTSSDSGKNWIARTSAGSRQWYSITSSADGTKLVAGVNDGYIYYSLDSGLTWTISTSAGSRSWGANSLSSSADGTKVVAGVDNGYIYTSTNSGITWATSTPAGSRTWSAVKTSADGMKIFAVANPGYLHMSLDGGVTWTESTTLGSHAWWGITASADGNKLAAVDNSGYIYTYQNASSSLSVDIILPQATSTFTVWNPYISWGTATICEYSYDGGSLASSTCANDGSDIPAPAYGAHTLTVKGTDASSTSVTKTIPIKYSSAFYWCNTVDSEWNNANNWYIDNTCTAPYAASSTPLNRSTVILLGNTSPIVTNDVWMPPANIDTIGLTGSAKSTGIIFSSSTNYSTVNGTATFNATSTNLGTINGTSTFNGYSRNRGTVNGSMIINSSYYNPVIATATSTLTFAGSAVWEGTTTSRVYSADGVTLINNYIFTGSSTNHSTLLNNPTFFDKASNYGTINGDPTFNNISIPSIGNVLGTVNLTIYNQTILGSNTITNLIKNASLRDTLYIAASTTQNITNLTLHGVDANNLLSVYSTIPNIHTTLNVSGLADLNFVRLKDIWNTGPTISLIGKTVFDDGGNSGFTFNPNSGAGQHSFVTHPPSAPGTQTPSNPTNPNKNLNTKPVSHSNLGNLFNLDYLRIPDKGTGDIFSVLLPVLQINSLDLSPLPTLGDGNTKLSFTFIPMFEKFLFAPLPKSIISAFNSSPSLVLYFNNILGINYEKDLTKIYKKNLALSIASTSSPNGLYIVTASGTPLTTYISLDNENDGIYQVVRVGVNAKLRISLRPINKTLDGKFENSNTPFIKDLDTDLIFTNIQAPQIEGKYTFTTPSSPFPLIIEVKLPKQDMARLVTPPKKAGFWEWLLGLVGL